MREADAQLRILGRLALPCHAGAVIAPSLRVWTRNRDRRRLRRRAARSPAALLPRRNLTEDRGMQRAMNAVRSAVPFIQRLLPLLDGNILTAARVFSPSNRKSRRRT